MDVEANNSLRSQIALFLEKHCPAFRYKGRANHVGYWETVFNGYISNVCDLIRIFGFQLGIPLQDLFQYDSLGNAICPKKHLSNTTKARCVGCPVGDSCEYKGLLNK